jgi:aspartyl-tRNA(Asn)/glutamyl-tRNA(Gln) amidotransferase subunit C
MAELTKEEVEKVALLGRLDLTDEEKRKFTRQLNQIIDYFRKLQEVDTEGVEPMSHPLALENVMRDDEPRPGLQREEILANAPEKRDGKFVVPRIVAD